MNDAIYNILYSVEDKLKSKGILIVPRHSSSDSLSTTVERYASNHKLCSGINGYLIVNSEREILCTKCEGFSVARNSLIKEDVVDILINPFEDTRFILDHISLDWFIKVKEAAV